LAKRQAESKQLALLLAKENKEVAKPSKSVRKPSKKAAVTTKSAAKAVKPVAKTSTKASVKTSVNPAVKRRGRAPKA
jgi:hypothetical protein